jgi:hypothetical protein
MVVTAATLAVGSPAYAADQLRVSVVPFTTPFATGSTQVLQVGIEIKRDPDNKVPKAVTVAVSGLGGDFSVSNPDGCTGAGPACQFLIDGNDTSKVVRFTIKANGNPAAGQQSRASGKVTATLGGASDSADFDAVIKGPDQSASVAQVSGVVKDSNGAAVKDARVLMVAGGACASKPCETGTNSRGEYAFRSTPDKPILPGTIQLGATKTGFENSQTSIEGKAGQSVAAPPIVMRPKAAASASAEPTQEVVPGPTDGQTTEAPAAQNTTQKKAGNDGNSFSWIVVSLAGLLVLLGVGVLVMMLINRKKGDAEEDGDEPSPHDPNGAPVPGAQGVYHGAGDSATMVGHPGAPGSNAATAIIRAQRPEDEYPDPYAAYPASPGGYQPAAGGYDPNPSQYGNASTAAYGAGANAYGAAQHQQPGYGPPPGQGQGYGGPPTAYAPPGGQYGGSDPYAAPPAGYNPGGGYNDGQQYGGGHQGGYQQQPPQGGGYSPDPRRQQQQPQQQEYYQEPTRRGDRRSLDWLDD